MARKHVTDEDQGKTVIDSSGREIGLVTDVRSGTAYVNPDPGPTDSIRTKLGWGDADEDDYVLDESRIDTVTDDEVRLNDTF